MAARHVIQKGLARQLHGLRTIFHLVWTDASRFVKVRLLLALGLITAASALTALGPLALKLVIDSFTGVSDAADRTLPLLVVFYVISQWLARTVGEVRGLVYARAERRMARVLSERLFAHVLSLPLNFHLKRQTGAISQILQNGLSGYQMVLHTLVFTIVPVGTELGTILVVLSRLHQRAFLLLFFGALLFYGLAFAYAAMTTTQAARRASAAQVDSNAVMTDIILNYETIKSFAAEPVAQARMGRNLVATEDRWVGFYRRFAYNGLGIATIFAAFLAITVAYAAHEVRHGGMTVGSFILVNTYMLQIVRPVELLGYAMQSFSQGLAFLEKLLQLLREVPEPSAAAARSSSMPNADRNSMPAGGRTASATQVAGVDPLGAAGHAGGGHGEIIFENVSLSYGQGRDVLNGVSFRAPAGTTLGIVGPSGAGKSTLVRLLIRLYEPDDGRILLDGVPIAESAIDELRRAVAIVPQDTVLFNDTIYYNIAFGRPGATQEDVVAAAKLAHLHDFITTLPDGYNTPVGERGLKLSGGERQRIAIARAAIKRPRIYVFDEATSSLDTRTEREILCNLVEVSRNVTTLIIAHRLSTVVHADQIVFLEAGTIPERGTHAALLAAGGRYSALWHLQQRGSVAA